MTNQILQTDIDLARKLMAEGLPDQEIVQRLVFRRIAPEKADLLVQNLRSGVLVRPETEVNFEWGKGVVGTNALESSDDDTNEREPASGSHHPHKHHRHHGQGKGTGLVWVLVILILVIAGVCVWYFMSGRTGHEGSMDQPATEQSQESAPTSTNSAATPSPQ